MAESGHTLQTLADNLGAPEKAVRFLLSLLLGYPLAFLYRSQFFGKPSSVQDVYFIVSGILVNYFMYGGAFIHTVINTVAVYVILQLSGGSKVSVILTFVLSNAYLICGYFLEENEGGYSWTTPHCVLTLKLTSVAFDLYDGQKSQSDLSAEEKKTCLKECPSFLSLLGYAYFFGAFLAGPQFDMKRYLMFTRGALQEDPNSINPPASVVPGLTRLGWGVFFIGVHHAGGMIFPQEYMLEPAFTDHGMMYKCAYVAAWAKMFLYRYIGVWLFAEGSCIVTGISYNGKDINGNIKWNGIHNVRICRYERSCILKDYIASFNCSTNVWMGKYIFKRLKFLGNKLLSQAVTLLYLAVWHGILSGYFMNFFLEFFMVNAENQITAIFIRLPGQKQWSSSVLVKPVLYAIKKAYSMFLFGYALLSFVLLDYTKYMKVYRDLFYLGHLLCVLPLVLCYILGMILPREKSNVMKDSKESIESQKKSK